MPKERCLAVLAKANRVIRAADYRRAFRRGRRHNSPNLVTYILPTSGEATRYGFVVARSVGNAVTRNRVRRRLKAICYSLNDRVVPRSDVVFRALPAAAGAGYAALEDDVVTTLRRARVLS